MHGAYRQRSDEKLSGNRSLARYRCKCVGNIKTELRWKSNRGKYLTFFRSDKAVIVISLRSACSSSGSILKAK
jgi:hypothetical protein